MRAPSGTAPMVTNRLAEATRPMSASGVVRARTPVPLMAETTTRQLKQKSPTDSSTVVMQVNAKQVGVTGRFTYKAEATSLTSPSDRDVVEGQAVYDPLAKPFEDGKFFQTRVGEPRSFQLDRGQAYADQKPLGYMVVVFDNASGRTEALTGTLEVTPTPPTPSPSPTVSPTAAPTGTPTVQPTTRPTGKPTPPAPRPGLPRTGETH